MDYSSLYGTAPLPPGAEQGLVAFALGFALIMMLFVIAIYVYMAICLMKIAKKTNTPNAWFAWIPFLNIWLMIQVAKKEWWWFLLFFIPLVNIVASIVVWMGVAKALGKPEWLGILMIVPFANLVVPGYLAFSKSENVEVKKEAESA